MNRPAPCRHLEPLALAAVSARHRPIPRKPAALTTAALTVSLLAACAGSAPVAAPDALPVASGGAAGGTAVASAPSTDPADGWVPFDLEICPMQVSNAPQAIDNRVVRQRPLACVNGVEVHVAPAPGACLSSGFGQRARNDHKGVDYHSRPAGDVVAAAAGIVREVGYREKDFGNWVVIDHGNGVYTGYAHLDSVMERMHAGASVEAGQTLGRMGSSGRAARAVHLHYEVRLGDYDTPRRWWGLTPIDPFAQPESCTPDA